MQTARRHCGKLGSRQRTTTTPRTVRSRLSESQSRRKDGANSDSLVGRSTAAYSDLKEAEQGALNAVRAFANYALGMRSTMKLIKAYDSMLGTRPYESNAQLRVRLYEALLAERPWGMLPLPHLY